MSKTTIIYRCCYYRFNERCWFTYIELKRKRMPQYTYGAYIAVSFIIVDARVIF